MKWRVIPPQAIPTVLKFHGACALAGAVFAVLVFLFGNPRSRESLAVVAATLWIAIGILWVGYLYAQRLLATGAKRGVVNLVLVIIVSMPAFFLFLMPRWGPIALVVTFTVFVLSVRERESGADAP